MDRVTTFSDLLRMAEDDFWTDFERASRFIQHGDIGTAREKTLASFLRKQLPSRYMVESGEAIDQFGDQSGQIDLMIYDSLSTKPLMGAEGVNVLLPAEALLATIEVKTRLSAKDISNTFKGIKSQYSLSPYGDPWSIPRLRGEPAEDRMPRLFTTLFAYETDLGESQWAEKEMERIREQAKLSGVNAEKLNRVVVLDHGFLIPAEGNVAQTTNSKGVLSHWFFTLINFLAREVERRKPFPWADYEFREELDYQNVAPALEHEKMLIPRTKAKKSRMRKRGLEKRIKQS